jgi:hypothetical protein
MWPLTEIDEPIAALDPDGLCAFYGLVDQRKGEGAMGQRRRARLPQGSAAGDRGR